MIKDFKEIQDYMINDPEWDKPEEYKKEMAEKIINMLLGA